MEFPVLSDTDETLVPYPDSPGALIYQYNKVYPVGKLTFTVNELPAVAVEDPFAAVRVAVGVAGGSSIRWLFA